MLSKISYLRGNLVGMLRVTVKVGREALATIEELSPPDRQNLPSLLPLPSQPHTDF